MTSLQTFYIVGAIVVLALVLMALPSMIARELEKRIREKNK